ncbi:MAG TPA: LapA family protein [Tetragenococcus sp.]|nr:LapA family protein [Tetragenococcus sp.]
MKNQWRIILGLILTLLIVIFAVMNNMSVPINFGLKKVSAPLVIIIIGSAFIGAIVIALVTTTTIWQQKREIKTLNQQLNEAKQDIEQKVADRKQELERDYNNKVASLQLETKESTVNLNDDKNSIAQKEND